VSKREEFSFGSESGDSTLTNCANQWGRLMLIYHLIFHLSSSNWPSPDGLSKLVLIPITPVTAKPSSTLERRVSVKGQGKR
jgi:hypothetical protein